MATPDIGPDVRTAHSPEALRQAIVDHLRYLLGRSVENASHNDWYFALAYAVRDRVLHRWVPTASLLRSAGTRTVSYLSAEFLMGPHLSNNLVTLGIESAVREALAPFNVELKDVLSQEEEPGLGNGGLGRLAACFLDSLATLSVPAIGYGIRYEFGIFDQTIRDGWQVEIADEWLRHGNPWEVHRPDYSYPVFFGGSTETWIDASGGYRVRWLPDRVVTGVAYDTPVAGFRGDGLAMLRLFRAEAPESFDFRAFNRGDYWGAVADTVRSETISKVLYPNDDPAQGKQLRLEQQYFFVSCALQDMLRLHAMRGEALERFHLNWAVQMNDTHPAIAVAELMRLLVDENLMDWDAAWEITRQTLGYTNHTLLPEALEKWPLPLFQSLLPRHLEIIYEINRRFLDEVRSRYPGDADRVRRMSLIDESGPRFVRMAHLATVGSHAVNGVARLHSELLRNEVLNDFCEFYPERFHNVTNGVTPRRFMLLSNPRMSELITNAIGDDWVCRPEELRRLEALASDPAFQDSWRAVKRENKERLAAMVRRRAGVTIDPAALFDIQVKRIHEYKRQHLNVLHIITLYNRLRRDRSRNVPPRVFLFGGKAAPGYFLAKLIIKLVHSVAEVVNRDPAVAGRLAVAFLPDFNVTNSQPIYPAADLSEQISTAGKEASGTGNMKFALNGALTIGTLDGANVEIREEVGTENFFLFGLTAAEVVQRRSAGYRPWEVYESDPELKETIDLIANGNFSRGDANLFRPLVDSLLGRDEYLLLADYRSYVDCQERVSAAYADSAAWTRMSIVNTARMGKFSSDRAIRDYCRLIWNIAV
jgi:starch phosphorylase